MLKKNLKATRKKLEGWLELGYIRYFKAVESLRGEKGATAVEYALIVGLIAAAIIGAVSALGDEIAALFDRIATQLAGI